MERQMSAAAVMEELGLVNPCWEQDAAKYHLAARLTELKDRRAGFLDNRKDNADVLLKHIAQRLEAEHGTRTTMYSTKFVYSRRAELAMLDELAANCDFVVTATGA